MSYLPKSKKGKAFLATLLSTTTYYAYDYRQSQKVKEEIEQNLKEFGLKVIAPQDRVDKVKIFIAPSFYAMNWFNSYYRPYLYIGGMDYDLEQQELNTDFLLTVSKLVKKSRRDWSFTEENIKSRSWVEYFMGKKVQTRKVLQVNREFKGIVGIGPEVYDQVKVGYEHGLKCLKEECNQDCFPGTDTVSIDQTQEKSDGKTKEIYSDLVVIGDEKDYPRLLKMPGKEQTGWRGFPKRIFWAFHQRWILKETGDELVRLFKEIEELS